MKPMVDIICPSFNNPQFLNPMVQSMVKTGHLHNGFVRLIIVNNGKQPCKQEFAHIPNLLVVDAPDNLGWEGGLALGLKSSDAPFVCFQNDDVYIPQSSFRFYENLVTLFSNPTVGMVGPTTTTAAGIQSIYHPGSPCDPTDVRWMIGFCMMVRRTALDACGGVDTTLPGGDDFDISIRMRDAGYRLLVTPTAFLIHHGFKTGQRVHGDHNTDGGWNSPQMQERTNKGLIDKHGFKKFYETMCGQVIQIPSAPSDDSEGKLISNNISQGEKVLEIGCGATKTVADSVGLDRIPAGEMIPNLQGAKSVADIVGSAESIPAESNTYDVVIARHVLEHCLDTVETLREWVRVLKPGGRLIIAVPDEDLIRGIPMNIEHVHAFNRKSLGRLAKLVGLTVSSVLDPKNGVSFISIFDKPARLEMTLDRAYEGDCSVIPLEAYVVRGND
jgi:GT2 family glycosyltransferase/SAM-dependent methyltransferase